MPSSPRRSEIAVGPASILGQGPHGEKAASPEVLKLSDADAEKVKAGHFKVGVSMQTVNLDWSQLQVSDAWGDLVYNGAKAAEAAGDIKIQTNERYARTDTSVTAQILKVMAARPDAVLDGGSGTQGALPLLTLAERGFKGNTYGTVALVNPDFVNVGGKAADGIQVSAGPVIVAEQLPDEHFAKKIALDFRSVYQKTHNIPTTDGFSAYSFDAWLIFANAAERALKTAKPGTAEFRTALRDAILSTKELPGVHAVYNFKPGAVTGVDERSLVVVRLTGGAWKYAP